MRQWVENLTTILRTRGTDRERGGAARQYRMRGGLAGNRGWAVDGHRRGFRIDATHNVGDLHPVGSVRSESACVVGLRRGALDGL